MQDERTSATRALLDAEERLASAERSAYSRGNTDLADEIHHAVREIILLRRKLGTDEMQIEASLRREQPQPPCKAQEPIGSGGADRR